MKRATRRTLFVLAFVLGLGYFAFTVLFHDPFEGSYLDPFEESAVAIEYVVPRDVDFFVHKRGLAADFDPEEFPVPRVWDEIRLSRRWRDFERTEWARRLAESLALERNVDRVREICRSVPLLDPLDDLLGRDAALFGRFGREEGAPPSLCLVAIGSQWARFAYEALGHGWLRSLLGVPLDVVTEDDGLRRIGLPGGEEVYAFRYLDLFAVGTQAALVRDVARLVDEGRERSLGYMRRYHATVAQDVDEWAGFRRGGALGGVSSQEVARRLQAHVDLRALFGLTDADERFREPRGRMSRWILAQLFDPSYFETLTLDVGFGNPLDVRGMLVFDKERASRSRTGFYDRKTFELRRAMDGAAALLPADTFFVMAARVDPGQFLPALVKGLEAVDPDAKELLDDLIRRIRTLRPDFRANDAMEAARVLAGMLGQDVVVALKRDTYFGPPADPMPLVCLLLQVEDRGPSFEVLEKARGNPGVATGYNGFIYPLMAAHSRLQQEGKGVAKWYRVFHEGRGTPNERLIQDVILRGTEIRNVAFGIVDPASKTKGPWTLAVVLSPHVEELEVADGDGGTHTEPRGTAHEFVTDIVKLNVVGDGNSAWARDPYRGGTRRVDSLLRSEKWREGGDFLQGFASVAAFLDFAGYEDVLRDRADLVALEATEIDWREETRRIEESLLAGEFAQWRGRPMPPEVERRFQERMEEEKDALERERQERLPEERRIYEESLAWVRLFRSAFLAARIDERSQNIELRMRVGTRLDE